MEIVELHELTGSQVREVQGLMGELEPAERIVAVVEAPGTHFFAAVEETSRIVGCATLSVYVIPTGRKAWVEDVVVHSSCRGQHIGKR